MWGKASVDIHLAGDGGALEQGGGPRPLGDDGGGGEADGHLASSVKGRVQVIRVLVDMLPHLNREI